MFLGDLSTAAENFALELSTQQLNQFDRFFQLTLDRNQKMNLTAIVEPNDFAIKHIIDSLSLVRTDVNLENKRVIDVGTGAGFPGIPLKIFCPSIKLTLLDSLNKRVEFLRSTIEELGLEDVDCIHARAEEAAHSDLRESFDIAVARAVSKFNVLTEYCLPFVSKGGSFIAFKGANVELELAEAKAAIKILGGKLHGTTELTLPNGDARSIVEIEKIASTPIHFPRRPGIPERKPLSNSLLTGERRMPKQLLEQVSLAMDVVEFVKDIAEE